MLQINKFHSFKLSENFGLVWFYGTSTIVGYLMTNSFLFIYTVLFQAIQFSVIKLFSSIRSIDRTLSGATTPSQNGPGSDGNGGSLCIPQSSSIRCSLVSYPGHSLGRSASLTDKQSVYSTAPVDWVMKTLLKNKSYIVFVVRKDNIRAIILSNVYIERTKIHPFNVAVCIV